ncbi:unnamed protein product [Schistocephalus solidus]|uniref:Coiled-coil domain-containing protein 124 n=1 Tax=Schistocephalus solidus TaxID=70667 RepID=A0A183T8B2_SCHSO|nr:unnamed protein product [Schistocephalus solidus]
MPKKFGTNTKSKEARDKREAAKQADKAEKETRHMEQIERKNQLKKLHDEEMDKLESAKPQTAKQEAPSKLTQAQIAAARERLNAQLAQLAPKKQLQVQDYQLQNPNRTEDDVVEARTVEDAIKALRVVGDEAVTERHPEKRMKAVYMAYEERVLPELRKENPGMRLSQLKQLAFKNFQTSPENPKNQPHLDYNTK